MSKDRSQVKRARGLSEQESFSAETKDRLYRELEAGNARIASQIATSWGNRKTMADFPCNSWAMFEPCQEDCYLETVCEFAAVYRELLAIQGGSE